MSDLERNHERNHEQQDDPQTVAEPISLNTTGARGVRGATHPAPEGNATADFSGFARRGFADQLSIDTPEGVALTFPVAGIGSRFVALLLDTLLQIGVVIVFGLLLAAFIAALGAHRSAGSLAGKWFIACAIFAGFLFFWGYFTLFEAFWNGQTPGKRAVKLRVIKDSGRGVTLFESLTRNLLRVVDYLPSLYLAGVITMLANRRNKRLGDLAAGTLVIHDRPESQPLLFTGRNGAGNFFALNQPPNAAADTTETTNLFPADRIARLSAHDLVVIEAFFARALDLPLAVRATLAEQILAGTVARMGVPVPAGNPERSLEAVAVAFRAQGRRF